MVPNQPVFRLLMSLAALLLLVGPVAAQQVVPHTLADGSELWIDGTSTRSDWTVYAEDMEGNFALAIGGDAIQIQGAQFAVRATEIVSRRSTIMDRLIDDALQVEEHPVIRYDLQSATPGPEPSTFQTQGTLTIAGETREVQIDVTAERLGDGRVRFTGSHPMKFSEYGMQAPVAMFGALRTGDEVTVHFNVIAAPAP